jgi:hypothetical protein
MARSQSGTSSLGAANVDGAEDSGVCVACSQSGISSAGVGAALSGCVVSELCMLRSQSGICSSGAGLAGALGCGSGCISRSQSGTSPAGGVASAPRRLSSQSGVAA